MAKQRYKVFQTSAGKWAVTFLDTAIIKAMGESVQETIRVADEKTAYRLADSIVYDVICCGRGASTPPLPRQTINQGQAAAQAALF